MWPDRNRSPTVRRVHRAEFRRFEIAMQDAPGMGVLNCARYLAINVAIRRGSLRRARRGLEQAAASGKLHAEERKPVLALAHFIDGQNVWMIKIRRRLRFAPETLQRLLRIRVISEDAL